MVEGVVEKNRVVVVRSYFLSHPGRYCPAMDTPSKAGPHWIYDSIRALFFGSLCRLRRSKTDSIFLCCIGLHLLCSGGDRGPYRIYLWTLSLQQPVGTETRLRAHHHPAGLVHDDLPVLENSRRTDPWNKRQLSSRTCGASFCRSHGDDFLGHGDGPGEYGGRAMGMGAGRNLLWCSLSELPRL